MKENNTNILVPSEEDVARLLSPEWIVKGELQHTAFILNAGESYISVNRPAIDSFEEDVLAFLNKHPYYHSGDKTNSYQCAILNVGEVNNISVAQGDTVMDIKVEVEARDSHTKSHAGIFTRVHNMNIKNGQTLKYGPTSEEISADTILLHVRFQLLALAKLETHFL